MANTPAEQRKLNQQRTDIIVSRTQHRKTRHSGIMATHKGCPACEDFKLALTKNAMMGGH